MNEAASEFSAEIEQASERVPFRIRAHHLQQYSALVHGATPEEVAKETLNSVKKTSLWSFWQKQTKLRDYRGLPGQGWSYKNRLTEVFKRFNDLPDDYPVDLAEEQRDHICDSCAIGKHCDTKRTHIEGDPFADSRFLDSYLAEAHKRSYTIEVQTETATFSDAPPQEMRVLGTTAGAVRDILKTTVEKFAR